MDQSVGQRFQKLRHGIVSAAFIFVLICFPIASHAGGLAFAPLAAIAGIAGYLSVDARRLKRPPLVILTLALFLMWVFTSSFWSPYQDPQLLTNPVKLLIGILLYSGVVFLPFGLPERVKFFVPVSLVIISSITAGLLLFDQVTGYSLSYFVDPPKPDVHPIHRQNTTYMNLSHSITVLALMTPVMITILLRSMSRGKIYVALWILTLIGVSILGKLAVGLVAGVAGLLIWFLARKKFEFTLDVVIGLGMISILFAPLIGYGMNYLTPEFKTSISPSWEHRIEMWAYVAELVSQKPFIGHGFDAARTFDETFDFRGFERTKVSLHPHNAGLHIWSETGAIGAALASATLFFFRNFLKSRLIDHPEAQIAMCGFLGAALMICTFTYGVWQEWWWGILFLIGSFILIALMNDS